MVFQKNSTGIWSFLHYQEIWFFFFRKYMIIFLRRKRKNDLSQNKKKNGNMMFSSNVRKDGISKKIALKYDLQYLRRSYVFFSRKYYNFFMDEKWKMIFLKKICYFQYICINVTNIILPFYQKNPKGNLLSKKYT